MAIVLRALACGALFLIVGCGSSSFTGSDVDAGDGGGADSSSDAGGGDAGSGVDAADDGGTGGLTLCPGTAANRCEGGQDLCCVYRGSGGGSFPAECVSAAKCPATGPGGSQNPVQLGCSRSGQCPGGFVCCIQKISGGATASCMQTTSCPPTTGAVLCEMAHPNCPFGLQACMTTSDGQWGLPTEFGTCGGVPPR